MIFLDTTEQLHQEDLERLKSLRYMDDDFMTVCLADNFEGVSGREICRCRGKERLFGDGSHILYVNGKYRGNDEIGKLMHDFSCTNPDDMNYEALAKKARYFKQNKEGVAAMCKIMEDMRNEAAQQAKQNNAKEIAIRMVKAGKMSRQYLYKKPKMLNLWYVLNHRRLFC